MKAATRYLPLCVLFATSFYLEAKDLPDACGDDSVHFHVTTEHNQPLPSFASDRAQVVFIESIDRDFCLGCNPVTARVAIDGAWIGATKDGSYVVSDVAPGLHQACADWQRLIDLKIHVAVFRVEAGKTYFFLVRVTDRSYKTGNIEHKDEKIRLYPLGHSEGYSLLKDAHLSVVSVYH
jgi:hypothetical protein